MFQGRKEGSRTKGAERKEDRIEEGRMTKKKKRGEAEKDGTKKERKKT
jgi:hypothetical protein